MKLSVTGTKVLKPVRVRMRDGKVVVDKTPQPQPVPQMKAAGIDTAFIAALKGKAPAASVPEMEDPAPALPAPEPVLAPQSTSDLEAAHSLIMVLNAELGAARARVAELEGQVLPQIDAIAQKLGATPMTVPVPNLSQVFGNAAQILNGFQKVSFADKLESNLRLALDAFSTASSGAFEYTMKAYNRRDFFEDGDGTLTHTPARMLMIELKPAGVAKAVKKNKIMVVTTRKKIFYEPMSAFIYNNDKAKAFLNKKTQSNAASFHWNSDEKIVVYTDDRNISDEYFPLEVGGGSIPRFTDKFCAEFLSNVLESGDYAQAKQAFKAMVVQP